MRWIRRVVGGGHAVVRRRRVEQDLDEELRVYLETAVAAMGASCRAEEQSTTQPSGDGRFARERGL